MAEGTLTPDLCVLGGGHAAAGIAMAAATLGLHVVLVRNKNGNRAAQASSLQVHALAAAAAGIAGVRRAALFGATVAEPALDFARMREGAQAILTDLARNESDARLTALGVRVIRADGRFMDSSTVTAGDREIRARRILLVPSFTPAIPQVRGLPKTSHFTADRILELRERPRHLVVIGAGATGLSLAQSFRRFGAEVSVIEKTEPLAREDRECANLLLDALEREGIRIYRAAEIERVEGKKGEQRITFRTREGAQTIEATHLLLAAGWHMDVGSLGLELANIETGENGIAVGSDLRTSNPRVFFAANGSGLPQADAWYGRLVLANLMFRMRLRPVASHVARATATDPAIAHVGLDEAAARGRYGRIQILRRPFAENEASVIAQEGKGLIKLVTTSRGYLVGATIVGPGAGEMIAPYALAISRGLHLSALAAPMFPHPTRAEIGQQAALAGLRGGLTSPWVRRIIAAMRWFG
jgi:pyruvate/2-oxoglutarate dehydrogenase complex dihydrolipoamide dehydrogenase (E3) component